MLPSNLSPVAKLTLSANSHHAAYLQLFRTGDSHLRGPDAASWFARLEAEQDNLRAAFQWALDAGRYADMALLVVAANWYWTVRGQWYEAGWWLARLLPHRAVLTSDLRLAILICICFYARTVEEFQPADQFTGEQLQLLESGASKLLHGPAWYFIAFQSQDFHEAAEAFERSIAAARAAGEAPALGPEFCLFNDRDFVLVTNLWGYATFLIERGEVARAQPLLTECLSLYKARANQYEVADALSTLGTLAFVQGDRVQARTHYQEALTLSTAVNNRETIGYSQPLLALVTLYSGDAHEARRLLSESLRLCLEMKDSFFLARVCAFLAEVDLGEGNLEGAEDWLIRSLVYHADPHKIVIDQVQRLFVAARLATAQQRYARAAILFGLAAQVHSAIHFVIAGPMRALADAALATVRAELDPAVFAAAFDAGQQLSLGEAFATILAPDHSAPATPATIFAK